MSVLTLSQPVEAVYPLETVPAPVPLETDLDAKYLETASKILAIIHRYQLSRPQGIAAADDGKTQFLAQIYGQVATSKPILMCLPAFPFKSPNTVQKVLGRLPDKAEEFALAHLNGLCAAIQDIYVPGAKLMIISDGLVYNDLLSVPDSEVWAYGEALRKLSSEKNFSYIEFSRLKDIVNISVPNQLDEITYVANATNFRHSLLTNFSTPGFDVSTKIHEEEDTCLTYRGYIKFLTTDLQNVYPVGDGRSKSQYKRGLEYIAKQMLTRGDAFAQAVKKTFPDRIRLSIHPSIGMSKISISLLPTDTSFTTPWHCSIGFRLDGTITSGHRSFFEADERFELVHENGRPSFFREKSELWTWAQEGGGIICEPLYPAGVMIRPKAAPQALSIENIDAAKVRALSEINSPVILRDFAKTVNRELFVNKSYELGTPQGWKFGLVLEVKDRGADTRGLNNVLSAEWMPYHYDGLFKTEKRTKEDGSEEVVSIPPRFQFFTSATASPKDTGFTLFATSTMVLKYLPKDLPLESLRPLTWSVSTSSFNATTLKGLPLITDHPTTGQPCLRFHEPWPQSRTKFDATCVDIENPDSEHTSTAICELLTSLLHDRRVSYYHTWNKGDLLISDNILAMHTRSDFTAGCDRELWRINFD
ncbi:putative pyoverdine/dityrosine biosynthesis protein [Xylariales sp. PMI_506]|nr:putative pyoverdine/dityrosine biosynthesis protein [Xylariales sp. PMI_506]